MRILIFFISLSISNFTFGQQDEKVSTIDFVQILNNNKAEAIFYYEHNWKILRDMALDKGYIYSYQLLETDSSEDAPFNLLLITTYSNKLQYDQSEDHFDELIQERGELKLLNDKKPGEFRKIIFSKELVRHLN